jgi:hypothetical protein
LPIERKNGDKRKEVPVNRDTPVGVQITSIEKASQGLALLTEAILELLRAHPEGLRNTDIAKTLALESEHAGKQRDYLTYSILGLLLRERKINKVRNGANTLYIFNL